MILSSFTIKKSSLLLASFLFFGLITPSYADHKDPAVIFIYAPENTNTDITKETDFVMAARDKLEVFMKRSGIPYEIKFQPFSRALRISETENNVLLFELARTPLREKKYHWLMPFFKPAPFSLVALADKTVEGDLRSAIAAGKYTAACDRSSMSCEMLNEFGFPKDQIFETSITNAMVLENLLLRKRVDFIAGFSWSILHNLSLLKVDSKVFKTVAEIGQLSLYLAAPMHFDKDLLSVLNKTNQSDLPLLPSPRIP